MEDASLQGGLVVCTRWRLRSRLGKADGRVWEAENVSTHERVAIRFLARPAAGDAGARRRFEREVRSMSKLRSPYLLPIVDHGHTESGVPFVVTEFLKGQDLGRWLGQERVLGLIETSRVVDQVGRGLGALHAAGLAHGDLRPQNVFLLAASEPRTWVRLLGLGFRDAQASEGTQLAPDGTVTGMSPLLSPERLQPSAPARIDPRSDVWALGVLAYRMLTGVWPFDVNNWGTVARSIQTGAFTPVSARRKDLPAPLDGWFAQALQPERGRRFQNAEEARVAFERIALVYTAGMLAEPQPSLESSSEPPRNPSLIVHPPSSRARPSAAWRIAGGALLLIGLVCFALREPLSRWAYGAFETPRFWVSQLASRASAAPPQLPEPPRHEAAGVVAVRPPQPTAAAETPLMSPPPELPRGKTDFEPRGEVPRVRAPRLVAPAFDVLREPPPEPRPRAVTAAFAPNEQSPDLPAPSHVYRGF